MLLLSLLLRCFRCSTFNTIQPMKPHMALCVIYSLFLFFSFFFTGTEWDRIEGQVLWQPARLVSSVLCQPPCKTLKSVMLTSCNTVTLYRNRKTRWEGITDGGSTDWDRAWGMERENCWQKNLNIYSAHNNSRILLHSHFFFPTHWLY